MLRNSAPWLRSYISPLLFFPGCSVVHDIQQVSQSPIDLFQNFYIGVRMAFGKSLARVGPWSADVLFHGIASLLGLPREIRDMILELWLPEYESLRVGYILSSSQFPHI